MISEGSSTLRHFHSLSCTKGGKTGSFIHRSKGDVVSEVLYAYDEHGWINVLREALGRTLSRKMKGWHESPELSFVVAIFLLSHSRLFSSYLLFCIRHYVHIETKDLLGRKWQRQKNLYI